MGQKRGQFYIMATIIIAGVFVAILSNQSGVDSKRYNEEFYLLADEVYYEAGQVINYELHNGGDKMEDFFNKTIFYINSKDPEIEFVFIYSNKNNPVVFVSCMKNDASIESETIIGGSCISENWIVNGATRKEVSYPVGDDYLNLTLDPATFGTLHKGNFKIDLNKERTLYMLFKKGDRSDDRSEIDVIEKKI